VRTWPRHDGTGEFLFDMWFASIMMFEVGDSHCSHVDESECADPRTQRIVSVATASAGAIGYLLSQTIGFSCPFRKVGFACPGCGCSRAVDSLFSHGPVEMLRTQPTATIFLLFIGISLVWTLFSYLHQERGASWLMDHSQAMLLLVLLSASSNWIYQLVQSN